MRGGRRNDERDEARRLPDMVKARQKESQSGKRTGRTTGTDGAMKKRYVGIYKLTRKPIFHDLLCCLVRFMMAALVYLLYAPLSDRKSVV